MPGALLQPGPQGLPARLCVQWKGWVRAYLSLGLPLAPGLIGEPVGPVVHCSYQGQKAELPGRLREGFQ